MKLFLRGLATLLLLEVLAAGALLAAPAGTAAPWAFWERYAARFISADGRVADPDRGAMTTSEGQSYAMFFALVANDPAMFERLRSWTETNLARGDLGANLPAWSWGQTGAGEWSVLDPNSASDADLWLAYDLIQAGTLWSHSGYSRQGSTLLRQIALNEVAMVPELGPVLLPARTGFHSDPGTWLLNPSYMPPPLFNAAAHTDPSGPWKRMAQTLPGLLKRSRSGGYAMDWVSYSAGSGFVAASGPGDAPKPPQGSYDAIRVYLWIGIGSRQNTSRAALIEAFAPMSVYLRAHPLPPESIAPDGTASGIGPLGFSAALTPFLWSSHQGLLAAEQQRRTQGGFDPATGLLGSPARYYDQNLALFSTAWLEKRFSFGADGMLRVPWKN